MQDNKALAREKRETTIQYLKIISYSLWLVMTVVGVVIAFKYAQVMDHVSGMMEDVATSVHEGSSSDDDYSGNSDYSSSDY